MEQRTYRGNVLPEGLADYLVATFNQGYHTVAQRAGQGDQILVQIGQARHSGRGGIRNAMGVSLVRTPDGLTASIGQSNWLNMADPELGGMLIGAIFFPRYSSSRCCGARGSTRSTRTSGRPSTTIARGWARHRRMRRRRTASTASGVGYSTTRTRASARPAARRYRRPRPRRHRLRQGKWSAPNAARPCPRAATAATAERRFNLPHRRPAGVLVAPCA